MKYFAAISPMLDEEKSTLYRPDHLNYLQKLQDEGRIFAKGRFADGTGGLVIYKADNLAEVEKVVKQDPYVVKGARSYEIHEWEMTQN
ncbi:hypothetical protein GCM10011409_42410 [Lentibacillus populi]|uniref:YCII-related domain-containing protein n=1 Tax=Lentibacillus populi TaxID=1827502 RepID=A0A9W5X7Z6_9BACI|nr:YciI family protein [Lentibacillus populi]GGB60574.1 hypothetical protein GCM10011409_42410 [Lentibacillus populi]